jgi:hypothetical protein
VSRDRTSFDFQSEADIYFAADGVADNGLLYGAFIDLPVSTSDSGGADEVNIYMSGGWGRVELGDQDGAGDTMDTNAPLVGNSQVDGSFNDWAGWATGPGMRALDTGDQTKVIYYSPRFSGFQVGVSYAPYNDGGENTVDYEDTVSWEDGVEIGANYVGNFGNFDVLVAGAYNFADGAEGTEDLQAWSLGTQIGFGNFEFGGSYVSQGDSLTASGSGIDTTGFNVGATWSQGPWAFGVSYVDVDFDGRSANWIPIGNVPTDDAMAAGVGVNYVLAPGLAVQADLVYFDIESTNSTLSFDSDGSSTVGSVNNDGWVVVTAVNASF